LANRAILLSRTELSYLSGGDNLLQSGFWGEFKEKQGWTPHAFRYDWQGQSFKLLVLVKRLFGVLPMAYVPFGPELGIVEDDGEHLRELGEALLTELPLGTLFLRFDMTGCRTAESSLPRDGGLKKAPADIQPPDTVILDIDRPESEILANMHKKWRYNINLSGKKGVRIVQASSDMLYRWYEIYRATGERDKIALHPESYYQRLFDLVKDKAILGGVEGKDFPDLRLYLAYHEEELLAGIITSFYGNRATYLYGASSNSKRNLMPAYLLQWEAIKAAREAGCSEYDFFGIPPTDDPEHPMHGLYRFKTNFGGDIVHYWGCWDRVYGKLFYQIYRLAEQGRQWYYKKFKKRG
jgi:lipid II:glycine glycyltransferase (peptidoglycan interpeptide bridge formation enzyme)